MYYQQGSSQYKESPRISNLCQDNLQLQKALKQLNECYQEKVSLLEEELRESKKKQESLLSWKSQYIDKQLFSNSKYEQQVVRLATMMEQIAHNYQHETNELKKQIDEKDEQIQHLKDQNQYLRKQKDHQQLKIQELAQKYIIEIERLNNQLKELKDEIDYEGEGDDDDWEERKRNENQEQINPATPFTSSDNQQLNQSENESVQQPLSQSILKQENLQPLNDISSNSNKNQKSSEKSNLLNVGSTFKSLLIS